MKPVKIAITAALLATVLTSGWQTYSRQERAQQVARLRAENDQMRRQASERYEASISQARVMATAKNPPAAPIGQSDRLSSSEPTASATRADLRVAGSDYRNEGQVSPGNALQTFAWACDRGELGVMEKLIMFDPAAREKIVHYFASMAPEARPKVASLETLAATLSISEGMKNPYPVSEILSLAKFEVINPERVVLRLPGANGDGYEFQHTAEGWKLAVTVAVADDYIEELPYRAAQH